MISRNVASALEAQLGRLDALVHTAAHAGLARADRASVVRQLARAAARERRAPMGLTRALMPLLARRPMRAWSSRSTTAARSRARTGAATPSPRPAVGTLARELADEWENRPACASTPSCPVRSARRCAAVASGRRPHALPAPEALVPLYLHLIAGQTKAESGALIDAQAWLTGAPCLASLRA